ncbi:hypothetical protein EV121DRAFT_273399 [Schizophyllum commune]
MAENRDPERRRTSKKAYYERNKARLQEKARQRAATRREEEAAGSTQPPFNGQTTSSPRRPEINPNYNERLLAVRTHAAGPERASAAHNHSPELFNLDEAPFSVLEPLLVITKLAGFKAASVIAASPRTAEGDDFDTVRILPERIRGASGQRNSEDKSPRDAYRAAAASTLPLLHPPPPSPTLREQAHANASVDEAKPSDHETLPLPSPVLDNNREPQQRYNEDLQAVGGHNQETGSEEETRIDEEAPDDDRAIPEKDARGRIISARLVEHLRRMLRGARERRLRSKDRIRDHEFNCENNITKMKHLRRCVLLGYDEPARGHLTTREERDARACRLRSTAASRNGTTDWSYHLSIPAALNFRNWLGGEDATIANNYKPAFEGAKRMTEIMGTDMMYPKDTGFELSMINVALPLPPFGKGQEELNHKAQDPFQWKVPEERNVVVPKFEHNRRLWTRLSGQVWLEMQNFGKTARPKVTAEEQCMKIVHPQNSNSFHRPYLELIERSLPTMFGAIEGGWMAGAYYGRTPVGCHGCHEEEDHLLGGNWLTLAIHRRCRGKLPANPRFRISKKGRLKINLAEVLQSVYSISCSNGAENFDTAAVSLLNSSKNTHLEKYSQYDSAPWTNDSSSLRATVPAQWQPSPCLAGTRVLGHASPIILRKAVMSKVLVFLVTDKVVELEIKEKDHTQENRTLVTAYKKGRAKSKESTSTSKKGDRSPGTTRTPALGGGKEREAPDWYKKKAGKSKNVASLAAARNVAFVMMTAEADPPVIFDAGARKTVVPEEHVFDMLTPTPTFVETANKDTAVEVLRTGNTNFLLPPLDNTEHVSGMRSMHRTRAARSS